MNTRLLMMSALLAALVVACRSNSTSHSAETGLNVFQNNQWTVIPNPLGQEEAIKVVSQLKMGMRQQDVENLLAAKKLRSAYSAGGSAHWISSLPLNDGNSLQVLYRASDNRTNGVLSDGLLQGAWIQSTNRLEGASTNVFKGIRFYQKSIALTSSP